HSQEVDETMTENRRPSAPWLALAVLALGLFMTLLDLTIVNVAIPSIVDDLHASLDQILWVLNGYSLAYAVLLITSGRLGDIFGPRNMFAAGIVVFTVASAFSGLAQDPTQLILARGLQGIGAAIIAPQGLPIMTTSFRRSGGPASSPSTDRWPASRSCSARLWAGSSSRISAGGGSSTSTCRSGCSPSFWRSLSCRTSGRAGVIVWTGRASRWRPPACSASCSG